MAKHHENINNESESIFRSSNAGGGDVTTAMRRSRALCTDIDRCVIAHRKISSRISPFRSGYVMKMICHTVLRHYFIFLLRKLVTSIS